MLLLWLFGLGLGVANACLAPVGGAQPTQAAAVDAGEGPHHAHPDAHAAAAHHEPAAKTNCQDFCDKAAATLPSLKSALDDLQTQVVFTWAVMPALPLPALASVQPWSPRRHGALAPPIPITLLRLAL